MSSVQQFLDGVGRHFIGAPEDFGLPSSMYNETVILDDAEVSQAMARRRVFINKLRTHKHNQVQRVIEKRIGLYLGAGIFFASISTLAFIGTHFKETIGIFMSLIPGGA